MTVVPHAGTWIEIDQKTKQEELKTSFPTRERGLKSERSHVVGVAVSSFPTRERGLKFRPSVIPTSRVIVVPHAGTWIEIFRTPPYHPYTGSFPTRERGLKSPSCGRQYISLRSFPTRDRGLKFHHREPSCSPSTSFPTRERGLKCTGRHLLRPSECRSPRGNVD